MCSPITPCIVVLMLSATSPLRLDAADRADSSPKSQAVQSLARSSLSAKLDAERLATDWGLQADEWMRFRQLMEGPLGVYSPNLDPLTALGIESRSDEERQRYAELQVRMEGRRVEKLIAYQRAYEQAWKRMYPNLPPVSHPRAQRTDVVRRSPLENEMVRVAVFVKDDCLPCDRRVLQLQADGRYFDIYVVDSLQDDTRIRRWATRTGIDPDKVRAGVITLNHDSGRWLAIGDNSGLPAVMREVNGQWQRD